MFEPPRIVVRASALLLPALLLLATHAVAEPTQETTFPVPAPELAPCDPATSERLDFVMARLEERHTYARRWWMGFTGFYGIGTVVSSVQASQEGNSGQRANYAISAVKAAFGTGRLWFDRPAAVRGAEPVREELPNCTAALDRGEQLLQRAARETRSRSSWKRHLGVIGVNVAGALIGGEGWGARKDAWISAATGIAVGEVMTWSHPWHGEEDLAAYESRFPDRAASSQSRLQWQLLPTPTGLAVLARF